jgi:hypothetical protein
VIPSVQVAVVALLGLLVGLAAPALIQVFLAARAIQRGAERVEKRVEAAVAQLTAAAAPRPSGGSDAVATVVAALVPAAVAAFRAARVELRGAHAPDEPEVKPREA